jgi:autotransporter-associated beta strand protein
LAAGFLSVAASGALAVTPTVNGWDLPEGGSWNSVVNWENGHTPTILEDATIGQPATQPSSPASVTLDANQTAYGLTLDPGSGKTIHVNSGAALTNSLTLLSADPATADGVTKFVSINVKSGSGNAITAPLVLGNGVSGSLAAVINSLDSTFTISGGISQSPLGQTWGVQIVGNSQGIVDFTTTPEIYGGDTTIGNGGILKLDLNNVLPSGSTAGNVVLQGNGLLQIGAATAETINGLSATSTTAVVTNSSGQFATTLMLGGNNATAAFAGSITNPTNAGTLSILKTGTGTQTLSGTDSYRGTTTISGGTLLVDGTHNSAGSYIVTTSAAVLGGIGTINLANANQIVTVSSGILAAGDNGSGVLNINGSLTFATTGRLVAELGGTTPGDGAGFYDQVDAGKVTLQTARLSVSLVNGFLPAFHDVFYILTRSDAGIFQENQPFDAINEGTTISLGNGITGKVTYHANWTGNQATSTLTGGNDVAIYDILVPEPSGATLLGLAMLALFAVRKHRA